MPTCQNCHNKWSWKQTVKKLRHLNNEMFCPYCGEKQYRSNKSKNIIPFIVPIMSLPVFIKFFFDVPIVILFSLFPLLVVIIIFILFPFSIKLSNEKEIPF